MSDTGTRKIETLKIFPYIAWGTVIIFAIFVYSLAIELRAISENLKATTNNLRQQELQLIDTPTTTRAATQ